MKAMIVNNSNWTFIAPNIPFTNSTVTPLTRLSPSPFVFCEIYEYCMTFEETVSPVFSETISP